MCFTIFTYISQKKLRLEESIMLTDMVAFEFDTKSWKAKCFSQGLPDYSFMVTSLLVIFAYMPCWAVNPWLTHWNGSIGFIIAKSKR